MRVDFYFSPNELDNFASSLEVVIRNVGRATKEATEQACKEILEESLKQVPRDTNSLASTGFYEVRRRTAVKGYTYEGVVGYAGMAGAGRSYDRVNPKSGALVSAYAYKVHEDLTAEHPNGGKAKFLEDPVREYGQRRFKRVAETYWRFAIEGGSILPVSG